MKLLSFTILTFVSLSVSAIEFQSCIDNNGRKHFTNLEKNSLDSNCLPKDHYKLMIREDYLNLENEYARHENYDDETEDSHISINLEKENISPELIKNKVKDIFDPDKALEELIESTEDRDDFYTNAMRSRAKGIDNIIKQGESGTP
jgi:hypothetical protein